MTTMVTEDSTKRPSPDEFFNSDDLWHASAPRKVAIDCRKGEDGEGWQRWRDHLTTRGQPRPLRKLLPGKGSPLLWNLPDELSDSQTEQLVARLWSLCAAKTIKDKSGKVKTNGAKGVVADSGRKTPWQEQLAQWLADLQHVGPAAPQWAHAYECLALAHALPALSAQLSADLWWRLLEHLVAGARASDQPPSEDTPLLSQLVSGELPLTLAYTFPEINACCGLLAGAQQALSQSLVDLLDGEGLPRAVDLPVLRPLLACWTRCLSIGERLDGGCWDDDAEVQYQWLVRQALRMARGDGSQVFTHGSAGRWCPPLFQAMLELGGDGEDYAAASEALPNQDESDDQPPEPAVNSEWSELAILRSNWLRRSELLAVAYHGPHVQIELNCDRRMLLAGKWEAELKVDDQAIREPEEWEEVCWVSDEDVDYLELEAELSHGVRIQRQILLARTEHFLYLADCVLDIPGAKTRYVGRLPLASDVSLEPEEETREASLICEKPRGLVLPLALPEWRSDPRHGTFTVNDNHIELRQETSAESLCCPLFIDLKPRRAAGRCTWRQLTVAESLKRQPPSVAVGYRVQCGKDQWLIYRSLAKPANRTLIGQNFSSECVVGRFTKNGTVEELLEIE